MATYSEIASVTVGSGGASFMEFTSIPSTYTDLLILISARSSSGDTFDDVNVFFNGTNNSGGAYTGKLLYGNGSSAASNNDPYPFKSSAATATASTFGNASIYIPNYAGSTTKSYAGDSVTENNSTTAYAELSVARWNSTAAITSIKIDPEYGSTLVQYSTAYLYGIKKD
jgi:hypothetical protein